MDKDTWTKLCEKIVEMKKDLSFIGFEKYLKRKPAYDKNGGSDDSCKTA